MAFQKGNKKPENSGKVKGTQNKLTKTARELFVQTLEGQVPDIQAAFNQVKERDPAKFLELFAKYAQYFVPKQVDITSKGEEVKQVFKIGTTEITL